MLEWSTTMGLCRMPIPGVDYEIAQARFSFSKDPATHGDKLFYLYAQDRDAYLASPLGVNPVGQFVVKESWIPVEVKPNSKAEAMETRAVNSSASTVDDIRTPARNPLAQKDGKTYRADRVSGLFILAKLDPKTPDTDNGWIYGTVTPDRKSVTSAGRVGYCMRCHESKPDRLYGIVGLERRKRGPN
jgi:hypothetical protein